MKSIVFVSLLLLCCGYSVSPAAPKGQGSNLDRGDPWIEVLSKQLSPMVQARLTQFFTASDQTAAIRTLADLPDPWVFPNTTHNMEQVILNMLVREGEVNTFNPTVYGLSKSQLKFTVDLSNDLVSYSLRWPSVTMQGNYNLWIDKWTFTGIWERRRGDGAYSHTFRNLDFNTTFQLDQRSDGRFGIRDMETSIGFQKCDVWSENYSINFRPIEDWIEVSGEWKEQMDQKWEDFGIFVEEGLAAGLGVLFGWPFPLTHEEIINTLEMYGAEIIGRN